MGAAQSDLRARLDRSIAERDRAGAVNAAREAVASGAIPLDRVYPDVLVPLLVDTGSAWEKGEKRVWEEHLTSSIVRTIVEALHADVAVAAANVPPNGRTALLACPAGEQHDLGLRMIADRMTLRGWTVHFLGADTPPDDVIAAAKALGADLVMLSAATHYNLVLLRSYVARVKTELPGVRVGVGGPAFSCDHSWPAADLLTPDELGLDDEPEGSCPLPPSEG